VVVVVAAGEAPVILHATQADALASSVPAGGGGGNANAKVDDEDDQSTILYIVVAFFVVVLGVLGFVLLRKNSGSSSMTRAPNPRGPSATYQNPEFAPQNGSTAKRPDWADPNVPFLSRPEAEVSCCRPSSSRHPFERVCRALRTAIKLTAVAPKCPILGFFSFRNNFRTAACRMAITLCARPPAPL